MYERYQNMFVNCKQGHLQKADKLNLMLESTPA